jgi:hypothetical protein
LSCWRLIPYPAGSDLGWRVPFRVLKPKHLEERGIITRFPHLARFFSLKGFTGGTPVLPNNEASRMTPNAKLLNLKLKTYNYLVIGL